MNQDKTRIEVCLEYSLMEGLKELSLRISHIVKFQHKRIRKI